MIYRVPNEYYTENALHGVQHNDGLKHPSPDFSQGQDIVVDFLLTKNGVLIDTDKYKVEAILKKSAYAENVIWQGTLNDGIFKHEDSNLHYILIKREHTAGFLPGTYFVDIVGTEQIGTGDLVREIKTIILSFTLSISLTASSPYPKLYAQAHQEVVVDKVDGMKITKIITVEPTMPTSTKTTDV